MMTLYLEPTWEREFRRLVLPSPDLARALTRRYLARVDKSASWVELKRGVEAGVIELGHLPVVERLGFASGTVLGAMFGFVADSIHPATTEVPLLDKTVAAVLNAGVTTGMFADPLPDDASEVAAAHHYIANVTAFPLVDLDALLDIRAELSGPLIAFRGAMADLAREIDAQPSDERFEREADAAYRRVVAPRLAELRELSEAARILPVLRREILENKGETVVSSAIAFAVAGAAAWPQMAQAAAVALAAGADVASGAYSRYRRIEGERRANKLLWLYEFERTVARHEK
jgi:hypothetical protein